MAGTVLFAQTKAFQTLTSSLMIEGIEEIKIDDKYQDRLKSLSQWEQVYNDRPSMWIVVPVSNSFSYK